jgi:RHS repeat-associated protein
LTGGLQFHLLRAFRFFPNGVSAPNFQAINPQLSTINFSHYSRDHLGSIREVTASNGAVGGRYDYDAWGNQITAEGKISVDFGYTGHYFHQPSGLNLTRYRAYSPALGRWLNRDPIGELGGINLYSYVNNEPIRSFDPLGLYDYSEAQTRKLFLVPAYIYATQGPISGPLNIFHLSMGDYDFGNSTRYSDDTFCVNGDQMNAFEFGNFIAGYEAASHDIHVVSPFSATPMVYLAGIILHLGGATTAKDDPFDRTGIPYIRAGVREAQ